MLKIILFVFYIFIFYCKALDDKKLNNKLILILADGIRYDYLDDDSFVGFKKIVDNGVKVKYVEPIFPSNSYPNWYTIVTGLYAENHGMVQNFMFDPLTNKTFSMSSSTGSHDLNWWNDSEPIWITAEKNNIKTAVYWWDGCEVKLQNTLPTKCEPYKTVWLWPNLVEDFKSALNDTLTKFNKNEWQLALLYYEAIDFTGHVYGPESKLRKEAMKDLDDILMYLQDEIKNKNLDDQVNVLIVSDHGMINVESKRHPTKIIDIDELIDENDVEMMLDRGGMSMLYPKKNKEDKIMKDLKRANVTGLNFYKKDEMPSIYHYKNNRKIGPIILFAEKGYFIRGIESKTKPVHDVLYKGHHGYTKTDEMRTIFLGYGPKLRKNYIHSAINMTDHYNLFCNLIDLKPLKNDGDWLKVKDMLKINENNTKSLPKIIKKKARQKYRQRSYSQLNNLNYYLIILFIIINLKNSIYFI